MEGVIASALPFGLRFPQLIAFERIVIPVGTAHFDIGGRSANQRRYAPSFMGVFGERRHERKIDMDVRVDKSWKNKLPCGIDHFNIRRRFQILANTSDGFVLNIDVRMEARPRCHNVAIPDQQRHVPPANESNC